MATILFPTCRGISVSGGGNAFFKMPLFSTMFAVMRFSRIQPTNRHLQLGKHVLQELNALLDLFTLVYADLRRTLSKRVYVSDESEAGGGVVYADV